MEDEPEDDVGEGLTLRRRSFLAAGVQLLLLSMAPVGAAPRKGSWLGTEAPATAARVLDRPAIPEGALARIGDLRLQHAGGVRQLLFSPGGEALVSSAGDGALRFWDPATGSELRALAPERVRAGFLAFTGDGGLLVAGGKGVDVLGPEGEARGGSRFERWISATALHPESDLVALGIPRVEKSSIPGAPSTNRGDLVVYRASTGEELWRIEAHADPVRDLAFDPEGKFLISSCWQRHLRVWDAVRGRLLRETELPVRPNGLAIHPWGRTLAVAGERVLLLDPSTLEVRRELDVDREPPEVVRFSPDGRWLAAAGRGTGVLLWALASEGGAQVRGLPRVLRSPVSPVATVDFSPDGNRLAAGCRDGRIRLFETGSGEEIALREGPDGAVTAVAFSPDGTRFASASEDRVVRTWDRATLSPGASHEGHSGMVDALVFLPGGEGLLSHDDRGGVWSWGSEEGRGMVRVRADRWRATGFAYAPAVRLLARGGSGGAVELLDLEPGGDLRQPVEIDQRLQTLALRPDGKRLAVRTARDEIWIYGVEEGRFLKVCQAGHQGPILGDRPMLYTRDGGTLIAGNSTGVVSFLDPTRGFSPEETIPRGVVYVNFSAEGPAQHWDPRRGEQPEQHQVVDDVGALALSGDGTRLAVGDAREPRVVVMDVATRAKLREFRGHPGGVRALAFSPDGRELLSGGRDGTLVLWDVSGL